MMNENQPPGGFVQLLAQGLSLWEDYFEEIQ